jgi:hypothetical protein
MLLLGFALGAAVLTAILRSGSGPRRSEPVGQVTAAVVSRKRRTAKYPVPPIVIRCSGVAYVWLKPPLVVADSVAPVANTQPR